MTAKGSFPRGRVAFFVTSNVHKFNEARRVLAEYKVAAAFLKMKALEIQDNNLESIAKVSAIDAVKKCSLPIIVEDTGLFIEALSGFPGPYSSYVHLTIRNRGILRLMENVEKRDAYFHSVVVFSSPAEPPKCFYGKVKGKISQEEQGSFGFGFDPIFKPLGGRGKTFAEMTITQKNKFSHRALALRNFVRWYTSSP